MKLVINTCYGGFSVKPEIRKKYGLKKCDRWSSNDFRTDKKLIELIESGIDCNDTCSELQIVEIPDEATDYYVEEYDGAETVLYVINGKIQFL